MQHIRTIEKHASLNFRTPEAQDGAAIWELVKACKPLDENSMYCNLIQCDHFADTCVVAELAGEIVGWISAYVLPNDPNTLFVWQVAVDKKARGIGLGPKMIEALLGRDACENVKQIQTTITSDNAASWGMFRKIGRLQGTDLESEAHYKQDEHFQDRHATEHLVTIKLAAQMSRAA